MARNLNLNASLRLDARGFQRGMSAALRSLESFRRDFLSVAGALGASLGIGGIVSSLRDVATSLSVARATLKNTSRDMLEYGENLKFVDDLSKTYKQDLIVLTDSFAKFHAASMGTNFSLEQQKELYQGLTQAATFFHMSSERTENMMIAVEQMMSKGKVTAEELRRQLGNNLPGAYARVAQAAINFGKTSEGAAYKGIKSFADFESAMNKGQIGVDVLLQFVRELNETTKNFDTNSLQLAMNDLKNAWTYFVESTDVESTLKDVYSATGNVIKFAADNIKSIVSLLEGLLVGTIVRKVIPAIINIGKAFKGLTWGSWVGIAITALTSLISYLSKVSDKVHEVNRELKKIKNIDDDTEKLYRLQKMYREGTEYVNDPERRAKYGTDRQAYERSRMKQGYHVGGYASYDTTLSTDEEFNKYFEYLENLPKIFEQIEELQNKIDPDIHPNANDKGEPTAPNVITGGDDGKKKKKPKTVSDYLKDYNEGVKKLKNQLDAGSKTSDEYKDDLYKLAETTWQNITAFDNFREQLSKLPSDLQETGDRLEAVFDSSRYDAAAAKAEKDAKEQAEAWQGYNDIGSDRKPRDTRFDYRLSEVEKLRAQQEEWDGTVEDLKKKSEYLQKNFDKLGAEAAGKLNEVNAELKNAQENATNLKDAADLAEWQEEIKKLKTDLGKEIIGGIAGAGRGIKSLIDGAERIKKAFKDPDASDWDRIEAILGEIASTFQLINNLVETFNTLTKISEALSAAKGATELTALSQQVAAQGSLNAEKATDIALTNAGTVAQGANAAATLASTGAKSGEAVANATASGAKLPFPYNLAAIAAGVAAVVAALSMIKGFAGGGIISGSRHGDNNLAAVNGGEMILNSGQQARLWNMLNGKGSAPSLGSGQVEFKIRGSDLVGTLSNYNSRRRG